MMQSIFLYSIASIDVSTACYHLQWCTQKTT